MKKWLLALMLLGLVVAVWLSWRQHGAPSAEVDKDRTEQPPANSPGSTAMVTAAKLNESGQPVYNNAGTSVPAAIQSATGNASSNTATSVAASHPFEPDFTNFPPEIVLEKVDHAIHDYASMFGGNPVGTNPEITAALSGKNPRQANFINPEAGMRINGNGELVDAWGTPYFFHQISGTEMEIHSAGPDRIMWTSDDLVTR